MLVAETVLSATLFSPRFSETHQTRERLLCENEYYRGPVYTVATRMKPTMQNPSQQLLENV